MARTPDLSKVKLLTPEALLLEEGRELHEYLSEARSFLLYYKWCKKILDEYLGIFVPGIIGVFLFKIVPTGNNVDEWVWVIVGDIPPAYLTCELCPNPTTALDGYIGAMSDWVNAASKGESVANLIPVNVPATPGNADLLRRRLAFLNKKILSVHMDDLTG